jgi:hypothetical protein
LHGYAQAPGRYRARLDFPHIPDPKHPLFVVADAIEKGNNRISFAGLVRHGKIIFTVPSDVKPNLWRFGLTNQ